MSKNPDATASYRVILQSLIGGDFKIVGLTDCIEVKPFSAPRAYRIGEVVVPAIAQSICADRRFTVTVKAVKE